MIILYSIVRAFYYIHQKPLWIANAYLKQIFPCSAHRFEHYYVQHTQPYATIISIPSVHDRGMIGTVECLWVWGFYKQLPLTFRWNVMLRFRNHNFCCISVTEGDHQDEAPKVISEVWKTWASWQKICWKCIQLCASLENLPKPQKMIPILWGRFSILLKLSHRGRINGGITFEMDTISELWDLLTLTSQMVSNGYYLVTSKREKIITKGVVS